VSEPFPVCPVGELPATDAAPRWLVEPLWGRAAVGFCAGAPKQGKTWLGLDLALSVATRTPCLGRFPVRDPGPVLLYLAEDSPGALRHRLAGLCQHRGLDLDRVPVHVITAPGLRLDRERDRERLEATLAQVRPRLLLLDPLVRLHRLDECRAQEVAELLGSLRDLQRAHDVAIVIVHHLRKNAGGSPGQALRGSGDLHAWIDSGLYLRRRHDRVVLEAEHRNAPAPEPLEVQLVSRPDGSATHLEVVAAPQGHEAVERSLEDRVLDQLATRDHPSTRRELRDRLRVSNNRLGPVLALLEDRGQLIRGPDGWRLPGP